jgi:hypothetical protein
MRPWRCCSVSDVPKALVAAVVLRDQARPEWPDSSSMINLVVSAAAAAAGATAHEGMPPMAYRELAAACWAHEARDRWALLGIIRAFRHLVGLLIVLTKPLLHPGRAGCSVSCIAGALTNIQRVCTQTHCSTLGTAAEITTSGTEALVCRSQSTLRTRPR